jgi:hypothetical protein
LRQPFWFFYCFANELADKCTIIDIAIIGDKILIMGKFIKKVMNAPQQMYLKRFFAKF